MLKTIEKDHEAIRKRYYEDSRHTIQVDFIPYMDEIANFLGCKPNLYRIALTDPQLFYALMFGPSVPYQYRLTGECCHLKVKGRLITSR